ncbi:J domain-containing protein required for chloroplast accumulation response 1 [Rosa sericea]
MERFSQRESILLGYSPQNSFINSGSSPRSPYKNSDDVDFHDVFGGPPRRSSIQDMRYSFNDVTVTSAPKGDDEEGWSEKPVFGGESHNRRRTHSDDFFDDIFKASNSVSSSPRRLQRDPYSSSPGSRVLSPARPLPPKPESSLGSSLPAQFSLPAKLTKGVDSPPTIGAITRTTSLSRFSSQAFQSSENLKSDIWSSLRMRHLSQDFSVTGEGSSNLAKTDKDDTGGNLEQDSKSSESPTSSNLFQFHFSIYKWASKPMVMPFRGRSSSRAQATKKEEQSSTCDYAGNESIGRQSPISTLPSTDFTSNDHPLTDSTSSKLESNKQENDLLLDESITNKVEEQPSQFIEETILPVVESSETFRCLCSTVEDVAGATVSCQWPKKDTDSCHWPKKDTDSCQTSEDIEPRPLLQTACEDPQEKVHVFMEQLHKPEIKPTHSLFFDNDLGEGTKEITKLAGKKESLVEATKKSSVDVGSSRNVKNQNGKRSSLTNVQVDKAGDQGSLRKLGDNLGRNKVKGTVKDFVKMFNQEVSSKPKDDGDFGSRRFKRKEKNPIESVNEASISTTIMHEELQNSNVKKTFPDASSINIKEDLKRSEKEAFQAKTASCILNNVPKQYASASSTGSVANCSRANTGDLDESFHENFQIKELTQDEKKPPLVGNNHEELQVIDAKIRQWSKGKEGNIRSLLTTMQHIVWPESGWKTVPLVDIIEGNAVKRSYQRALLCLHPDKLQQKGATSQQKYIAEKVFDILQEAWNHFNSLGPL